MPVRWLVSSLRRRRARAPRAAVSWRAIGRVAGTAVVVAGLVAARRRWARPGEAGSPGPEPVVEPGSVTESVADPVRRVEPVWIVRPRLGRRLGSAARTGAAILALGGMALGACFAAIIPGAQMIATAHHYTADDLRTRLSPLSQRTTVYDAAGNTIGVLGIEDREPVEFDEIPPVVVDAVVATEDQTFWENSGVDVGSVLRALVTNASAGEIEQGGSTITQQLVKNRVYRANRELDRKVTELVLAYRLNQELTKKEILEEYLNTVYFGQGAYGVRAAAERFFVVRDPTFGSTRGKQLAELTLPEAALLAAVIANPEGDNPFLHPDRALRRRAETLDAMVDQGYATQADADFAEQVPLPAVAPPLDLRPQSYFVEEVQRRLLGDPRLGATPEARLERLLRGGLDVVTTLDPVAQFDAQQAVNAELPNQPPFTASLVAIEPATGAVRAMVGGPGFDRLEYNIVTQTPGRQVGSAWKVITLAAALEAGYSPNDIVDGASPCTVRNPDFGSYTTVNAEPASGGKITLRDATVHSVNCAYVRVLSSVGPPRVIDVARRLGLQQDTLQPYLSITLGTIEATPLEMATVASTIAAGGVRRDPYFVQSVTAPDGTVLLDERDRPGIQAIAPNVAACESDVLRGVVTGGTGTAARLGDRASAGKTGTTDNKTDAWFLGYTPQLVAAVWHGASTGAVPGAGFGGDVPARIWHDFMTAQLAGEPVEPFPAPDLACSAPGEVITDTDRLNPLEVIQQFLAWLDAAAPPEPPRPPYDVGSAGASDEADPNGGR